MRAYIAHIMDDSEELHSKLKSIEDELAATRKAVDEGARLLRKTEEERETTEAEAHRLKRERDELEAKHKEVEWENERMSQEMEELRAGFVAQNEGLEDEYKK